MKVWAPRFGDGNGAGTRRQQRFAADGWKGRVAGGQLSAARW